VVCLLSCAETLYLSYVAYLKSLSVTDRFHYLCSCCWSTKPEYTFLQFFGGPMISVTSLTRKPFITVYHWPPGTFLTRTFMFFFLLYVWGNSTNLVSCCSHLFFQQSLISTLGRLLRLLTWYSYCIINFGVSLKTDQLWRLCPLYSTGWQLVCHSITLIWSAASMNNNRNTNILVWNIRGINSSEKWDALRVKISESSCQIVCL